MRWILSLLIFAFSTGVQAEDVPSISQWANKIFETKTSLATSAGHNFSIVFLPGNVVGAKTECGLYLSKLKGDTSQMFFIGVSRQGRSKDGDFIGGFAGEGASDAGQEITNDSIRLVIPVRDKKGLRVTNTLIIKLDERRLPIQVTASSTLYPSLDCALLH